MHIVEHMEHLTMLLLILFVVLILGERRRRWSNTTSTIVQCVVFDKLLAIVSSPVYFDLRNKKSYFYWEIFIIQVI